MNPKRKVKKRLPPRAKSGRFMKKRATKQRTTKKRRRTRKITTRRKNPMAARKRMPPRTKSGRFRARRRSGGTTRRRTYRRNVPRLKVTGLVGDALNVGIGGAGVVAGKVVSRQGITLFRQDPGTPIGIAAQLAIAVAAGVGLKMFGIRGPFADGLVYGAAAGAAESIFKLVLPGQAEALLGEYGYDESGMSAYGLSAYGTGVAPVYDTGMQNLVDAGGM